MRMNSIFHRLIAFVLCMMLLLPSAATAEDEHFTVNLNDGVYTYGSFNTLGQPQGKPDANKGSFRSANYLAVEGGREITCYFAAAEWNNENIGYPVYVVEYDLGKNIVGPMTALHAYYPSNRFGLTLNERTAYIRIYFYTGDRPIETPLDAIELAIYYIDDYVDYYIPYISYSNITEEMYYLDPLYGKHIVYSGDDISESRMDAPYNGGAYAKMIADATDGTYINLATDGALLTSSKTEYSIVDNLKNLPDDGDLYCFQAGINDYFANVKLGHMTAGYAEPVNTKTFIGALEQTFRYCLDTFPGKPVCFVITHKVRTSAIKPNTNGDTFQDFHDAIVQVCNKYSIPYYDAFLTSGLNGWNANQSNHFMTSNATGKGDGTHPNEEGFLRYYVPQLLSLFRSMLGN